MLFGLHGDFSLQYQEWPLGKLAVRLSSGALSSSYNTSMADGQLPKPNQSEQSGVIRRGALKRQKLKLPVSDRG